MPWDQAKWNASLLETTKQLIALRKAHPALRSADYRRVWPAPADHGTMLAVFTRHSDEEHIVVAVNAGAADEVLSLPLSDFPGDRLRPLWGTATVESGEQHARIRVRARSAAMWLLEGAT